MEFTEFERNGYLVLFFLLKASKTSRDTYCELSAPQFSVKFGVGVLSQQRILVMKSSHISRASYQERLPCPLLNSSQHLQIPLHNIMHHHQPTTTTHPRTTTPNGLQIQNSTLFPHPFPLHSHSHQCTKAWNLHSSATPSWHHPLCLHLQAQMAPFIPPTNPFLRRGPFFAPSLLLSFCHGRLCSSVN